MNTPSSRKRIAIVLRSYVRPAQTWILRHAGALREYEPVFFARRIVAPDEKRHEVVSLAGRAWAIRFLVRSRAIKLVHIHFLWNTVWFFDFWKRPSIPVLATAHGSDVNIALEDSRYRKRILRTLEKIDSVICVSRFIREQLISLGAPGDKLIVNPLGVPVQDIEKHRADSAAKTAKSLNLICVAAFREEKGHQYLLEAVARVRSDFPDIRLDLVGDGPLKKEILRLIQRNRLDDCVRLWGLRSENEVFHLMAGSDIVLQHSIRLVVEGKVHREEGLPLCLVEAAALGLPLVATRVGGIPEICRHGITGLLSEEKDVGAMAANILELIRQPRLRGEFGAKARKLVSAEFDQMKTIEVLENLYRDKIAAS